MMLIATTATAQDSLNRLGRVLGRGMGNAFIASPTAHGGLVEPAGLSHLRGRSSR